MFKVFGIIRLSKIEFFNLFKGLNKDHDGRRLFHCFYSKCIPNTNSMQIIFSLIYSPFKDLKNSRLSGSLSSKNILKLFIYSYGYTPFCFTNSNNSPRNSYDFRQSISDKFLTNASRLQFRNCMLLIKNKFLLIVKGMYFSNPFGITLIFTLNLPISCII